jgi:drug/metabolite transporter (DMT)-like permease
MKALASWDLFALGAAACWAFSSLLSVSPSRHLGALAYTRLRMLMMTVLLWLAVLMLESETRWDLLQIGAMALSGLVGIFVGDTANFSAINRLGPRRAGVLFATNAVFSALLGYLLFDERMSATAFLGSSMTVSGVMIAILWGQRHADDHAWEASQGHPAKGILLGLLAALSQAVGALLAKPVISAGMDPVFGSAIRVTVACAALYAILWAGVNEAKAKQPATRRVLGQTLVSGFIGMGIGMTLLLLALKHGDVGQVAILSAVTPILILPLLWIHLKRPPAKAAWFGAMLTVAGTALIVLR